MFVKHIIKNLHASVTIVWPSSGGRLSCLVLLLPSLLVCVVKLFIWYVAVCCLCVCVCVPDVLVCGMFGCKLSLIACHAIRDSSQPNIPQTSTSGTHTHIQHTATYKINNLTTQTSRGGSNSTKHERQPLKMVKQLWPKHVGF